MARQWMTPEGFVIDEDGTDDYMLPVSFVINESQAPVAAGRIMSSLAAHGGLAGMGGIAGQGGGLAG